jgi:hypothetical protein
MFPHPVRQNPGDAVGLSTAESAGRWLSPLAWDNVQNTMIPNRKLEVAQGFGEVRERQMSVLGAATMEDPRRAI